MLPALVGLIVIHQETVAAREGIVSKDRMPADSLYDGGKSRFAQL